MTDQELQQAIDSTRYFLATPSDGMSSMLDSKKISVEHLQKLEQIQLQRAGMQHAPGVRPGAIVEMSKAVCQKCKADRLKEPCKSPYSCIFTGGVA